MYVMGMSIIQIEDIQYSNADDTTLIVIGNTRDSVNQIAKSLLKKITQWFSCNNLILKNDETVFLIVVQNKHLKILWQLFDNWIKIKSKTSFSYKKLSTI